MVEENEENLSEEALDWFDYFTKTYIGAINSRTGVRRAAKIKPEWWSQFSTVLQDKPYRVNFIKPLVRKTARFFPLGTLVCWNQVLSTIVLHDIHSAIRFPLYNITNKTLRQFESEIQYTKDEKVGGFVKLSGRFYEIKRQYCYINLSIYIPLFGEKISYNHIQRTWIQRWTNFLFPCVKVNISIWTNKKWAVLWNCET